MDYMDNLFTDNFDTNKMAQQPQIIICDYDNVLQYMDLAWLTVFNNTGKIKLFNENNCYMERCDLRDAVDWSPDRRMLFIYDLMNRNEYYIDGWFMKTEPSEEQKEAWVNSYKNVPYFYRLMGFNPIAYALRQLVSQSFCKELIILTHSLEDGVKDKRKIHQLKTFFGKYNMKKIKIKFLKPTTSKAMWIKRYKPDYTMFIDDRYDIIKDVILKTDSKHKTFLMPNFGYNRSYLTDEEFQPLIAGLGIAFSTYDDVFIMKKNGGVFPIKNSPEIYRELQEKCRQKS